MPGLSPSTNNSVSPTDPRRQPQPQHPQQQRHGDHDNGNSNNNNDDDVHDHDRNGSRLRVGSPDDIDVDVTVRRAVPSDKPSPVSTSSEGYPSWLPKRPPPPAPGSTLHSLTTHMLFGSDGAGPAEPGPASAASRRASDDRQHHVQTPTAIPFSGGRKPTPRSVRIVSMQDSNAAAAASGAGSGGRREPTDRTTTRVSSNAAAAPTTPSTPRFPSLPFLPFIFRSRVWSRVTTSALGGLSPTLFSSSQTPDARVRAAIAAPPKFRAPGLHLELLRDPSWKTRIHYYLFPLIVLAHVPLQTYLDLNTVYILIE
jgi:hypothetical protein